MSTDMEPRRGRPTRAQWTLAAIVVAFIACTATAKALKFGGLEQTAAFYIGVPLVLAVVLVLSPNSGNLYAMALKVVTIVLLLSVPLLGEGFVCVLFAAPLFYGVALLVVGLVNLVRKSGPDSRSRVLVVPALFALLAMEGVVPATTVDGNTSVSASTIVDAGADEVSAALGRPLAFSEPTGILAAGFPRPHMDHGSALEPGQQRVIMFDGAHHRTPFVAAHHWGTETSELVLQVDEVGTHSVRMHAVSDTTPLATWLAWKSVEIGWLELPDGRTQVTWQLDYERKLSPSWYFGPLEQFVVQRAAEYLVGSIDVRA
ncbi:hypothetical protein [Rhodococcus sp. NPDC058521]|uniref:hypothetical protein n=1 Tax=Rhodococcus sp. NPDC058521 TaxID=3346536 RepID=UPI00364F6BC4